MVVHVTKGDGTRLSDHDSPPFHPSCESWRASSTCQTGTLPDDRGVRSYFTSSLGIIIVIAMWKTTGRWHTRDRRTVLTLMSACLT